MKQTFRQRGASIMLAYNEALNALKDELRVLPDRTIWLIPEDTEVDPSELDLDGAYAYEWYDTWDGDRGVQERRIRAIRLDSDDDVQLLCEMDENGWEDEPEDPWSNSYYLGQCSYALAYSITMDSILDVIDEYLPRNNK